MMHVLEDPVPASQTRSLRDVISETIAEIAALDKRVVQIESDFSGPSRRFFETHAPERLIETGIAEANALVVAAGLASEGFIPYWLNFGYLLGRAYNQIRQSIAEDRHNVKIGCFGVQVFGVGGSSHSYFEDIAVMRVLPNFVVLAPADDVELRKATWDSHRYIGPVYIRFPREPVPRLFGEEYPFRLGESFLAREGKDITIIACGSMVASSLEAARILERNETDAAVINMSTIKPIDEKAILKACHQTGAIVTAEEHSVHGGLGDAVASVASQGHPVPIRKVGINDRFAQSGKGNLKKYYGLTAEAIAKAALELTKKTRR